MFTAKRLDLRTMEEETATTEHKKRLKFLLPIWSISGCNGSYLTTIAGIETTEGMCFWNKLPKIWTQITCCFYIKNETDPRHLLWVSLHQVSKAVLRMALNLFAQKLTQSLPTVSQASVDGRAEAAPWLVRQVFKLVMPSSSHAEIVPEAVLRYFLVYNI